MPPPLLAPCPRTPLPAVPVAEGAGPGLRRTHLLRGGLAGFGGRNRKCADIFAKCQKEGTPKASSPNHYPYRYCYP